MLCNGMRAESCMRKTFARNRGGHTNDKDATKFLLNSVDEDLKQQLYQACKTGTPFIGYWLRLIKIISSTFIKRFEKIKKKLEDMANY